MANNSLDNSAFSLAGGDYSLSGDFSLAPTSSVGGQPFEFTPAPKRYGPGDLVSYFAKGVATGTKSTAKNFMTVVRANAVESHATGIAAILQAYEDKLQGAIEGGFGAPDEGASFAEHPVMATAYNVGAGAPLMAGAMAATAITRNPAMPIALFAIPSFGNFYDQATSNGVKHEDAMKLATANMVLTGASVAIPMGQFAKAAKQVNLFKYASAGAAKSVIGDAVKSGAFKTASQAALLGAEMGTFNAAQAAGEGVLRNIGWDDPDILAGVGESMAAGLVTGAVMGGAVQHVVGQAKANFIRGRMEAIKAQNPNITPQDLSAKTKQAADIFDQLSEVVSQDPVKFLNKFNEIIGLPVTMTKLSGAKGSKVQVETVLLGNDEQMLAGERVIKPLLKKDKDGRTEDYPLTYTHQLLREAINNLREGKSEKDARLAVKDFKENTLDNWFNMYVLGAGGKTWNADTEVWSPKVGKVKISDLARQLKDYRVRPEGSVLPDELTFYSHGLVDKTGSFIENSVASSKVDAILRGEWFKDEQVAMKPREDGTFGSFRVDDEGNVVVDAVTAPVGEPANPVTPMLEEFSKWKRAVDGKDIATVLQTIKGDSYAPLVDALVKYMRKAGIDYQVLVQGTDMQQGKLKARGRTDPRAKTVSVFHDNLLDGNSSKEAGAVLLHEGVHVATLDVLENHLRHPELNTEAQNKYAKGIVDLFNDTIAQLPEADIKAIESIRAGNQPTEVSYNNHYGFTTVHEFVSEGLTNKAFQEKLNNVFVDDGKTTVWTKLKKAVVDLIKSIAEAAGIEIKDNSVLTKLVDNVYGLLDSDIAVRSEGTGPLLDIAPIRVKKGDLWDEFKHGAYVVVSTNLGAIHGRGLAAQAKMKGLIDRNNFNFDTSPFNKRVITIAVKGAAPETAKIKGRAFSEQTTAGNLDLMRRELDKLNAFAKANPDKEFVVPFIGLGFGEGNPSEIMPILETLDSPNIKFISKDDSVISKYKDTFKPGIRSDKNSVPTIIQQADEIKTNIAADQALQALENRQTEEQYKQDKIQMMQALKNYEKQMGVADRRDKKEPWGRFYRDRDKDAEMPSILAERAAYEDARADMAKEALFVVDEDGALETVDLSSIAETGEQLAPSAPDTLVSNIADNYRDFISQVESLYLDAQRSGPRPKFGKLGQEAEATAIKKASSRYAALAWFNDLLKRGVDGPSAEIDASLTSLRKIRAIEAQLQKQEYDRSRELQLAKNDMDVARVNRKWNGPIQGSKNNIAMLKKILGPLSEANAILARNMFTEYQKSVDAMLKQHGMSAEFLYENPEILSNQELFMKKVRDLADERVAPQRKPTTKEEDITRRAQLKDPVYGRLDVPAVVGDLEVPAGLYRITHTGSHYIIENSTIKKTLSTADMESVASSIAFQIDQGGPVYTADFLMPALKDDKVVPPPDLKGEAKVPVHMVTALDQIGLNRNFGGFKSWLSDVVGRSRKENAVQDLVDNILAPLMWDLKGKGQDWGSLASSIMQPQDGVITKIISEIIPHMSPESGLMQGGLKGRELDTAVRKVVASMMTHAGEEFAVARINDDGTADIGSTMIGVGYLWEPGEMETQMRAVKTVANALGIPFDLKTLEANRPRRLWSELLKSVDPRLFQLLVYNKAHVEYPLVMAGIDVGLFTSHAMAARILSGYVHRVWEEGEEQQADGKSFKAPGGGKSARAPRRYSEERSYADWAEKTRDRSRMNIYDDYLAISKDYIKEYGTLIAQHSYLSRMKDLKVADPEKIADVIIAECQKKVDAGDKSYSVPDRNELVKKTRMLGIIDYQDSPHVLEIARMTQVKGKDRSGFNTGGIFSMLGMQQSHDAPGFAKFIGRGFEPPFVTKPVLELMDAVFSPRLGSVNPIFNQMNNILSYFKRGVSINPLDSPFLFKTAELVNTNPTLWVQDIFWPYAKDIGGSLRIAGGDIVKLIQNKKLDSTKVWEPTALLETAEDRRMFTNMRKHGGSHLLNVANALTSIYEKSDINKFDSTVSRKEEAVEYFTSGFGVNNEIFKKNIIPALIKVTLKKIKALELQGFSEEDAARIANNYVSNASGLRSPHLYGVEGDLLNYAWFARGLTNGFIAQITGAAYAPMKQIVLGLARKFYKTHTGKISRMMNPFVHAELSPKQMEAASVLYMKHLGKVFGMGLFAYAATQYLLSFGDDDKMDEHGQVAKGDPFAKKRFLFNNEPGKRASIRTSDKDENQRRIYVNPQFIREFRQLVDITGNFGSESMPEGIYKWHKNRLNSFGELMIAAVTGVDVGLGEKIIKDDKLPFVMKGEIMAKYVAGSLTPFSFGREDALPVTPDNPTAAKAYRAVQFFGVSTTKGQPMEEGITSGQITQARESIAVKAFYDQEMRDELQGKTTAEKILIIQEKYPMLSNSQRRAILFKGVRPGAKVIRSGLNAARQNERR
ncbi:hypothetical protein CCP3SC15_150024 [Gammaproteobacteria bacterium]